jgi:hypothetical protein
MTVQGKLRSNAGRVEFLCGSALLDKFSTFWPEFVIFESTLLGAYVAAIQQSFDQSDPMTFLASQHYIFASANKTLKNVYVRQGFKVSLQQFELLVSVPNIYAIHGAVTLNEIEQVREELAFAASLLRHTQVWEDPESKKVSELATAIAKLSDELRSRWQSAWDRYEADYLAQGKRPPQPKGVTQLQLTDVREISDSPAVATISEVLQTFQTRVRKANTLAKDANQKRLALHSEEYLSYCRVKEVTQLHPAAFRKQSHACDIYFPENLLDETGGPLLITAPAGYGKTSFCKWNTLNDVQKLIDKTSKMIPIYVPLHQLATANVTACEEAFLRTQEVAELFLAAHKNGQKVRVYLDGLDEVSTRNQQGRLMWLAQDLARKYSHAQVVVTGRDYVSGPWLRWLSRVHLSELNPEQVKRLVNNWLGEDHTDHEAFTTQLTKARTLQGLMSVPLLGTLIIAVFKKMRSLPESKVKLYEVFVDLMCGGWDLAKNIRRETRFGSQAKLGVLTRIAGLLHLNNKREAQEEDIRTAVKQSMVAFASQWRNFLDEIIEDGLLIRLGANNLAFSHLSFQEYLAATELTDPSGNRQHLILKRFLSGEDWWREVLAFYVGMSKRPDETEGWIRKTTIEASQTTRAHDLPQRFTFLIDTLASSWPGWVPREDLPALSAAYVKSRNS